MPRVPTKNRINMHDIVEQPLSAVPDAVDAVLRRPEPLDDVEVRSIFYECSFILLRAEEALSAKDGSAFCALFKLLSEGLAHGENALEEGTRTLLENEALLQTLHGIFRVVVEQEALPLHSAGTVELMQVLSTLCDGAALKDRCGALFMHGFVRLLQRVYASPEEARRHFHVQRGTATALINLVKGSKSNKQRLASWKFVADCCAASVDVFFQLQCVELLFRVSRQSRAVLDHLGGALPASIVTELQALPNDGTLLSRMTQLIEHLNEGRAQVLRYPLKEVVAADTTLTSSTDAYFTPNYVIVMVTTANADNITVPYRIIRSITLGRDGRVIIKLEEFPVKLEVLLSHTAGMDTVTFHMAPEELTRFKKSAVRQWIVEALQARKEEQQHQQQQQQQHRARRLPDSSGKSTTRSDVTGQAGSISSGGASASAGALRSSSSHAAGISAEKSAASAAAAAAADDDGDADASRKKARVEASAVQPHQRWDGAVVSSSQPSIAALLHVVDALMAQASTPNEAQAMLLQLRRLIEARKEVQRGRSMEDLSRVMQAIQARVDATRRTAQENRTAWHQSMLEDVAKVEALVMSAQDTTAEAVEQLNADLKKVKASNQAINERIACMGIDLQQTLEELRAEELRWTSELEAKCTREAERLEFEVDQSLLHRSRPSGLTADFIRQSASYS